VFCPFFIVSVARRALTNCVPRFCFLFLLPFYLLLYPSISIDVGATTGAFSLFSNMFLLVTTGWIFKTGLRENSIDQSINNSRIHPSRE